MLKNYRDKILKTARTPTPETCECGAPYTTIVRQGGKTVCQCKNGHQKVIRQPIGK